MPVAAPQRIATQTRTRTVGRMPMRQKHSALFYDILGSRILRLQDRLADLAGDDPRREVLIAILTELDDLKRDLAAGFDDD